MFYDLQIIIEKTDQSIREREEEDRSDVRRFPDKNQRCRRNRDQKHNAAHRGCTRFGQMRFHAQRPLRIGELQPLKKGNQERADCRSNRERDQRRN